MVESAHPTETERLDWLDGRVDAASAARLRSHHAACSDCAAALSDTRMLVETLHQGPLPAVPTAIGRRAHRLLFAKRARALLARAEELVATLVPPRPELVPALRDAGDDHKRYLWRAGEFELFATATRGPGGWELRADCLGADPEQIFQADLLDGRRARRGEADDLDASAWAALADGTYRLRFDDGERVVHTPPFVLA